MEDDIRAFAATPTPAARARIGRENPLFEGVVIVDSQWRQLYPRPAVSPAGEEAHGAVADALWAAADAEAAGGAASAVNLYAKAVAVCSEPGADCAPSVLARARMGLARCLVAAGRTTEALDEYARLALEPPSAGDVDSALFARFRIWEISGTPEALAALVDALRSEAFSAPPGQARYYLSRILPSADAAGRAAVAQVETALAERERDAGLTAAAVLLAPSQEKSEPAKAARPGTTESEGGRWRTVVVGGRRYTATTAQVDTLRGAGTAVMFLDASKAADAAIRPLLAEQSVDSSVRFELVEAPPSAMETYSDGFGMRRRVRLATRQMSLAASNPEGLLPSLRCRSSSHSGSSPRSSRPARSTNSRAAG